jgi:hypothetical protein
MAFMLHVVEESPRLTAWVQRHVNPRFTQDHYAVVHFEGVLLSILLAVVLSRWPLTPLVFLFLAFCALPAFLWNIVFHLGATLVYHDESPGTLTALTVYPLLVWALLRAVVREGLLTCKAVFAALAIGAVFHAAEVYWNVYRFGL